MILADWVNHGELQFELHECRTAAVPPGHRPVREETSPVTDCALDGCTQGTGLLGG